MAKPASGSSTHLVPWHTVASEQERRALLQDRLIAFVRVSVLLFFALAVFVVSFQTMLPELGPADSQRTYWFSAVGIVLLSGALLFVRSGEPSITTLYTADAAISAVLGALFGFAVYMIPDRPHNLYLPFIFCTLIVLGRVLMVPSRGTRTLVYAGATMVLLNAGYVALALTEPQYLGMPPLVFVLAAAILSAAVVWLAWVGSRVMFGLRKQVREAKQLGQYTLDKKLGEGGMGTVYRASHAMLRRPTAIKILRPERGSEENLQRFEREVQLTSQLTHPNTVEIYDYGTSPNGTFYYAMEYLDGIDLERLVQSRGPQPASRVIHILSQVCSALHEAHGRGLIHRDIKPANIILCQRGDVPDVVKVVDFGLVKDLEQDTGLSGVSIAGTPAYLCPEAIKAPESVGPASDLYALGATGYYLLTGEAVFSGGSVAEVCVHHVDSTPQPASRRTDNAIPARLDELILQCLEKDPAARPSSARDMREALVALAAGSPWSEADALGWWTNFETKKRDPEEITGTEPTMVSTPLTMTVDMRGRDEG